MLSANAFNMDQAKMLSFGKEINIGKGKEAYRLHSKGVNAYKHKKIYEFFPLDHKISQGGP